ncbi:CDP-diacylglycerol-phosphatidylglycerol phosphatidyltransferase [Sanguibacter keddieii DSM 10542]|uniref:CDP-diacylglycerol-phosphatidylglycerol phosphatidyltransferase n=1 Tax=Sanguibacter keddieii (strain ATCC 51767 / DSM 10542 / NCFB 3025 / ST-74) TaxID=446469 RepID=D1BH28_SANKS|nr:CDP-diacylglycerol-phosphatidylglycerol phosphatidyltransferase [Sanguibacter keddieii DSM 10542]
MSASSTTHGEGQAAVAEVNEQQVSTRVLTVPNLISLLRLALVPVFAVLIITERDVAALLVLAFSGFTDWLDGVAARRMNQVSKLGQVLDPAADRLFILVTLVTLAWRDVVPLWLVVLILSRDVLMALLVPTLNRLGYGPLPVNFLGKAATFALLYAFPLLLLAEMSGAVGAVAHASGWAFAWWGVGLYWASGALYVAQTRDLVREHRAAAHEDRAAHEHPAGHEPATSPSASAPTLSSDDARAPQ